MTLDELLTLPLPERVKWLRRREKSHDRLAAKLGTSRQTVISWEKGTEPKAYAQQLADVSGFPPEVWTRRGAETLVAETSLSLLRSLREAVSASAYETARALEAIGEGIARIEDRLPDEDGRSREAG